MSHALRIASGMFVGPGIKTGFWKLMAFSSVGHRTLDVAHRAFNFFEIIFQKRRFSDSMRLVNYLCFS
jgi:hypothetical protein